MFTLLNYNYTPCFRCVQSSVSGTLIEGVSVQSVQNILV